VVSDPSRRRRPHGLGHASQVPIGPGIARPNIMPLKSGREVKVLTYHRRFLPKSESSRVVRIYYATGTPTDDWANWKAHVCVLGPEPI
jgi:hypothetical protein